MDEMTKKELLDHIIAQKLVAVIRLSHKNQVPKVIEALVEGGIKTLEITSNTPDFLKGIEATRKIYPDILVGAGTIINNILANDAIQAGAQFLVTPNTDAALVKTAHSHHIPVLMGALTPTEIATAHAAGADIIKLFPAVNMGIPYFKAIKAPFKTTVFFAVGGIDTNNAQEWLDAGVAGLGIGGSLAKPIENDTDFKNAVQLAQQFIALAK